MGYWEGKRVIVTGGTGFVGTHLVRKLRAAGADVDLVNKTVDLREQDWVNVFMRNRAQYADVLYHLAATVGGIGSNRQLPAEFIYDNVMMSTQVADMARRVGIKKFIGIGSVCMYPKYTPCPFIEENLWDGYPEETNAPYGVAKRLHLVHLQALRQQYWFNGIMVIPTNLYGPGDRSDHVIPDLIRKMEEARLNGTSLTCWGTGQATRDFLYVEDVVDALMLAAEHYDQPEPVNLGSGQEISIAGLVEVLKGITGYTGDVWWDATQPDGQPRRVLNSSRAKRAFGWQATTKLEDGLRATVDWWRQNAA